MDALRTSITSGCRPQILSRSRSLTALRCNRINMPRKMLDMFGRCDRSKTNREKSSNPERSSSTRQKTLLSVSAPERNVRTTASPRGRRTNHNRFLQRGQGALLFSSLLTPNSHAGQKCVAPLEVPMPFRSPGPHSTESGRGCVWVLIVERSFRSGGRRFAATREPLRFRSRLGIRLRYQKPLPGPVACNKSWATFPEGEELRGQTRTKAVAGKCTSFYASDLLRPRRFLLGCGRALGH